MKVNIIGALFVTLVCFAVLKLASDDVGDQLLQKQQDGAILAVLVMLNENQIHLAKDFYQRTSNEKLQNFAVLVHQECSENLKYIRHLSKEIDTDTIDAAVALQLKKTGKKQLDLLTYKKGANLDKAYLQISIDNFIEARAVFAEYLRFGVTNSLLRQNLQATRERFNSYLHEAMLLKNELEVN